jgi:ankyrin repeat protein
LIELNGDVHQGLAHDGSTPLIMAAHHGQTECLQLLLRKNAAPNQATISNGTTALIVAAMSGHTNAVKVLLQHGAAPNLRTTDKGETALIKATEKKHYNVVKALLQNGDVPYQAHQNVPLHNDVYGARFPQKVTLEDAIGSHTCSLEALACVWPNNGIPLGCVVHPSCRLAL